VIRQFIKTIEHKEHGQKTFMTRKKNVSKKHIMYYVQTFQLKFITRLW